MGIYIIGAWNGGMVEWWNGGMVTIFPDIVFNSGFEVIYDDPYFCAVQYIKGKNTEFKSHYLANEASNILKYKQLCKISSMLKNEGFSKFIPVKGMYLLNTLFFDHPGIRAMADIDIIVHRDEFKKIPEFIKKYPELEYKSNFPLKIRKYFGEDISFFYNSTLIELHSKITLVNFPGLIEEIFENSEEKQNPDGQTFLAPTLEHAAIIMLLHDYSRGDFSDLNFKRIIEFYIVITNCDLKKLKVIAKKLGLDTMLDCHLFLIRTMIKDPHFDRYDFKIIEEFGLVEKDESMHRFKVENPFKLRKVLYKKRWKYLIMRNIPAEIFKKIAGMIR